jgi:hypothetical protein
MRILAPVGFVFALIACGGKAAPPPALPSAEAAEPTTPEVVPAPVPNDASVCEQRSERLAPVMLTAEQAARRHGANAVHFADAPSSMEQPIEVCMVGGEQAWLVRVTCADGSRAAAPRTGSRGAGGLCRSIIDHYEAKCPEQTYEVFMDMYMCGPGEEQ